MAAPEQVNSTITTGGTAKTVLAADPTRRSIIIQAMTEDMWCNFFATAAADTGFKIKLDVPVVFRYADFPMIINALSMVSATTGAKYSLTCDVN